MNTVLIADEETCICKVLRDFFQDSQGMLAHCAHTGPDAKCMLEQGHYDLALIGLPLTGSSGFDLAALAIEKDTAVPLMTAHPVLQLTMRQFAFPYLGKPFTLHALRIAAERVMTGRSRHLAQVDASLNNLLASRTALARALAESDRLLDASRAAQQLGHWDSAIARIRDALPHNDRSED